MVGLALAGWSFWDKVTLHEGNNFATVSPGEMYGDNRFGQTFVACCADLYRIDIVMSTYGRRNTKDVVFRLKEGLTAQPDMVSLQFNASKVIDEAWYSFVFPPISDSIGKEFYFYLESPASEPGNAITVMGQEGDPYSDGQAFINGQPAPGDVAFRAHYRTTGQQKADLILKGLTANKPSVFGDPNYYIILAVAYVLLLGALLWQISAAVFSDEGH